MKDVNIIELNKLHLENEQQVIAKERFEFIMKFYLIVFFIASFISMLITIIGGILIGIEINFLDPYLILILLSLPLLIFITNLLIYLLPIIKLKPNKNEPFYGINFIKIVEEQKKPTMIKYLIRKIFLITFSILGIISTLGNIILFIVEIII